MAKKATEKDTIDIRAFNKGFSPKEIKVGDRVTLYKVPWRESWEIGKGVITEIFWVGELMAFCDVLKDGKSAPNGEMIYLGKVNKTFNNRR